MALKSENKHELLLFNTKPFKLPSFRLELITKDTLVDNRLRRADMLKPVPHCVDCPTVTLNFALDGAAGGISAPPGNSAVSSFSGGEFAEEDALNFAENLESEGNKFCVWNFLHAVFSRN